MHRSSRPAIASLVGTCVLLVVGVFVVAGLGVVGVHRLVGNGNSTSRDELRTAQETSLLGRTTDAALLLGHDVLLDADQARRARAARTLRDETLPAVEVDLAAVARLHESDAPAERADVAALGVQWVPVRRLLNDAAAATAAGPAGIAMLDAAFAPLSAHLDQLTARETADARDGEQASATAADRTTWAILAAALAATAAAFCCGRVGARRIREAVEPARAQVEFSETLQLAESEQEAHELLQRHLERTVAGGTVTVLNRNNSADRLEAMTPLPAGSPLRSPLERAQPRSCLAIRSGRLHDGGARDRALLDCPVCGDCPGTTACAPLTVSGEVIGSVLIQRPEPYEAADRRWVLDSVGQAAPVLANLRNLAIAELRAATDSLTGLPNKRAVVDSVKRMLAQASRTVTPLALLSLDLDHFKTINDRYGHPVGDQALAGVGAALRATVRESDFAGRNGGEEFVVVLPNTDLAGAVLVAEKIRSRIAEVALPGVEVTVTASVGIAAYPEQASSAEQLERLADSALYVAKRSGRDRVEVATVTSTGTGTGTSTGAGAQTTRPVPQPDRPSAPVPTV